MKKWYAVYTKPGAEKKVCDQLNKSGFEAYCPLQQSTKSRNSQRKKGLEQPLFPNYVFVRVTKEQLAIVRNSNNVLTLVYWLGNPVEIRDIEVEMIKRFLSEHNNVYIERTDVSVGEIVKLISNPFYIEQEGDVLFVRNQVAKVVLPSLGYSIVAGKITLKATDMASILLKNAMII